MIAKGCCCNIYKVSDNSGRAGGSELVVIIKMVTVQCWIIYFPRCIVLVDYQNDQRLRTISSANCSNLQSFIIFKYTKFVIE